MAPRLGALGELRSDLIETSMSPRTRPLKITRAFYAPLPSSERPLLRSTAAVSPPAYVAIAVAAAIPVAASKPEPGGASGLHAQFGYSLVGEVPTAV